MVILAELRGAFSAVNLPQRCNMPLSVQNWCEEIIWFVSFNTSAGFIQGLAQAAALMGIRSPLKKILQELASAHCTKRLKILQSQTKAQELHQGTGTSELRSTGEVFLQWRCIQNHRHLMVHLGYQMGIYFTGHFKAILILWSLFVPKISCTVTGTARRSSSPKIRPLIWGRLDLHSQFFNNSLFLPSQVTALYQIQLRAPEF